MFSVHGKTLAPLMLGGAVVLGLGSHGSAAVVETINGPLSISTGTGEVGSYAVSSTDLVNAGQPTLQGVASVDPFGTLKNNGMDPSYANNGATNYVSSYNNSGGGFGFLEGGTLTFNLNTTLSPLGYAIDNITVLSGYDGRRYSHNYDVAVSYIDNPTVFVSLTSVNTGNDLGSNGNHLRYELQSVLTDTTGTLATGVAAIQFTFHSDTTSSSGETVYREIDVFGSAVTAVPAPAALPAGAVLLGLMALRRRRG